MKPEFSRGTTVSPYCPLARYYSLPQPSDRIFFLCDDRWQTETGTHMITPLPGSWCKLKPGSASLPFFGVRPVLLTAEGQEMKGAGEGILAIKVRTGKHD